LAEKYQMDDVAWALEQKGAKRARRIVVCDTGPLLHLSEANAIDLLRMAGEIVIQLPVERSECARYCIVRLGASCRSILSKFTSNS